jgi:hypothetical protein
LSVNGFARSVATGNGHRVDACEPVVEPEDVTTARSRPGEPGQCPERGCAMRYRDGIDRWCAWHDPAADLDLDTYGIGTDDSAHNGR